MPRWTTCAGAYIREDLGMEDASAPTMQTNVTKLATYEQGLITMYVEDGATNGTVGDTKSIMDLTSAPYAHGASVKQPETGVAEVAGFVGVLGEALTEAQFAKLHHYGYFPAGAEMESATAPVEGDVLDPVTAQNYFDVAAAAGVAILISPVAANRGIIWLL